MEGIKTIERGQTMENKTICKKCGLEKLTLFDKMFLSTVAKGVSCSYCKCEEEIK